MTSLLDINVLIALLDREHLFHELANDWFADNATNGWATCPLTQNGAVRILASPGYTKSPGSAAEVAVVIAKLCRRDDHVFWPDAISLFDPNHIDQGRIPGWRHLTDVYLLALARANGGRLATFDRRLQTSAVADGPTHLELIRG